MAAPRKHGNIGNGPIKPLSIDGSLRESASADSPSLDSPSADSASSSNGSPISYIRPSASAFASNFETLPSPSPSTQSFPQSVSNSPTDMLSVPSFNHIPTSPSVSSPLAGSHRRGPSVSFNTPPSPASSTFGNSASHRRAPSVQFSSPLSPGGTSPSSPFSASGKRHGRIHSRNLSVFFPRPENAAATAIAEDDTVMVESNGGSSVNGPPPSPRRLMQAFQFGGATRMDAETTPPNGLGSSAAIVSKRRGHHHKHSVSHSFFDFVPSESATQAESEASSPWPMTPNTPGNGLAEKSRIGRSVSPLPRAYHGGSEGEVSALVANYDKELAVGFSIVQFIIGALMWAAGQAKGSLACTGLGYWVVFDSSSLALGCNAIPWLNLDDSNDSSELQRPFG